MPARVLDRRGRNRALLARQLLLRRTGHAPVRTVEHLLGLQAQTPRSPYAALWSRLRDFDPMALSRAVAARRLVRIALMRSTIHLVSAPDALTLRPLVTPILMAELGTPERRRLLAGLDLDLVARHSRRLLEERPRTPAQLGAALAKVWPDRQPAVLAHAARSLLALVQVPPRGLWDASGPATLTTAESWLGASLATDARWEAVALRYLAAFGPASAADMVAWARVPGMAEVFTRIGDQVRHFRDERGRELFDLPRAPRPPGTTRAEPRYLPDYDNVLLGHADRNHVIADAHRAAMWSANGALPGTLLLDGFVAATWHIERTAATARLLVTALDPIPRTERDAIRAEGAGLLRFLASDARRTETVLR
jgi:Winged helix DNA-binding domain